MKDIFRESGMLGFIMSRLGALRGPLGKRTMAKDLIEASLMMIKALGNCACR